ncbi:hypothetical protein BDV96DRAFT_582684 [Lophiotrema nucula]|uniref:Uncharacterized protein n=1 Tax=Lophiotrema nucula TaxID=690887 RepID=A0A6A5YX49_9PLEO|nr:hypothetical protein BDV96DRAFT_582684 [Lophiotrema nucula]
MSSLEFSPSEIRLATVTLAAVTAAIPIIYHLRSSSYPPQETTPHVRTARKYLQSYATLRPQALTANASKDFTHTVLPSSLQLPSRSLEPFQMHASMIFSLFKNFSMSPQPSPSSIHFSPATNTVIAHCKMGGKVNGESEQGAKLVKQGLDEWWTECVLFIEISEDGKKVVGVREFVHSAKAEELKNRLTGVLES